MRAQLYWVGVLWCWLASSAAAQPSGTWTFREEMPTARAGVAAVVYEGQILVIGGEDRRGRALDVVERYDPERGAWYRDLPPLQTPRANAAAVVYKGLILVLGGRDEKGEVLDEVEYFDPSTRTWQSFPSLREEREGLSAVVLEGRLYVLGGSDDDGDVLGRAEYFNDQQEAWVEVASGGLKYAAASFGTVVLDDTAYAIGGFGPYPLWLMQQFRPGGADVSVSVLKRPRGSLAAVAIGDSIYIIGGLSAAQAGAPKRVLADVDVFVPVTQVWKTAKPLNTARESFAAVVVGNTVYVIGGRNEEEKTLRSMEAYTAHTTVGVADAAFPADFRLEPPAPNPAQGHVRIAFEVSAQSTAPVQLAIYDVQGRMVRNLSAGVLTPGRHEVSWNGTDEQRGRLSSGLYFCRLRQGGHQQVEKLILIR